MTVVLNPTRGGVMIADRIRQARLAAGLTLGALGEQVGVSHTAIQKYEKGLLTPSSTQLLKLARACGIRTEYFFRTHTVELLQPEFRKLSTFGKTAQDALKIKVVELVEKRVELLGAFPELPFPAFAPPANLPDWVGPPLHLCLPVPFDGSHGARVLRTYRGYSASSLPARDDLHIHRWTRVDRRSIFAEQACTAEPSS